MRFTKMQGLGNDYVYVNCFEVARPSETAVRVSDRHFGIGADGLILIKPSEKADFEMEMYNADGSRGEMCGNGIRCVAKYVYDYGLTDQTHISIETLGGIKYLDLIVEEGRVRLVRWIWAARYWRRNRFRSSAWETGFWMNRSGWMIWSTA